MLEKLKAVGYRAKLNCGHCVVKHKLEDGTVKINRCSDGPYCTRWFLHKSATLMPPGIFKTESIFELCSNGWGIETLRRQWFI